MLTSLALLDRLNLAACVAAAERALALAISSGEVKVMKFSDVTIGLDAMFIK